MVKKKKEQNFLEWWVTSPVWIFLIGLMGILFILSPFYSVLVTKQKLDLISILLYSIFSVLGLLFLLIAYNNYSRRH